MKLYHSLRAEFLKSRRTALLYLAIVTDGLISVIIFIVDGDGVSSEISKHSFDQFYIEGQHVFNFALFPILIVLFGALRMHHDYNDKRSFLSSNEATTFFTTKFMILHLMIISFLIAYNLVTMGAASIFEVIWPESALINYIQYTKEWVFANFQIYFSDLGFSALLFWLAWRIRNFILPIGTGFSNAWMTQRSLYVMGSSKLLENVRR